MLKIKSEKLEMNSKKWSVWKDRSITYIGKSLRAVYDKFATCTNGNFQCCFECWMIHQTTVHSISETLNLSHFSDEQVFSPKVIITCSWMFRCLAHEDCKFITCNEVLNDQDKELICKQLFMVDSFLLYSTIWTYSKTVLDYLWTLSLGLILFLDTSLSGS